MYLTRYATALEYYGLRPKEIRVEVDAVRADLAGADPDDVDAMLGGFGPPRTLAAAMTSELLRPSFLRGTIWFGDALVLSMTLTIIGTDAFLGGFEAVAEPGELVVRRLHGRCDHRIGSPIIHHLLRRARTARDQADGYMATESTLPPSTR